MPEKTSAGGLLDSLKRTFNLGPKKSPEAAAVPAGAATEIPALPESPQVEPAAAETPVLEAPPAAPGPDDRLPDWLQDGQEAAVAEMPASPQPEQGVPAWLRGGEVAPSVLAPLPEPEALSTPIVEVPVAPAPVVEMPPVEPVPAAPEPSLVQAPVEAPAEAEKGPEQLAIEQFEEALLKADEALAVIRAGTQTLSGEELKGAMAAVAKANGLIRGLPERYLRVLLASRRLGENREYNRMNFQEDMAAANRVFRQAKKG